MAASQAHCCFTCMCCSVTFFPSAWFSLVVEKLDGSCTCLVRQLVPKCVSNGKLISGFLALRVVVALEFFSAFLSAAAFWGFSRGGFPENACFGGAISERNFSEICRRKSPQNTEKHKTKLCAEVPERPLPKDPLFSC